MNHQLACWGIRNCYMEILAKIITFTIFRKIRLKCWILFIYVQLNLYHDSFVICWIMIWTYSNIQFICHKANDMFLKKKQYFFLNKNVLSKDTGIDINERFYVYPVALLYMMRNFESRYFRWYFVFLPEPFSAETLLFVHQLNWLFIHLYLFIHSHLNQLPLLISE